MAKYTRSVLIAFIITGIFFLTTRISKAQVIEIQGKRVEYILPYPGILPDHPLYFIKVIRDSVWLLLTQDTNARIDLYKHNSDKKINMALKLTKKGKWALSGKIGVEAEETFQKGAKLALNSKKSKKTFPTHLLQDLKLSNAKHREVLEDLLQEVPNGNRENINKALSFNTKNKKILSMF